MAIRLMSEVVRELRRTALLPDSSRMTDGQLLESFLTRREEAAFEVLVRRHGPMVLGVCRRVLHNSHDADDAFQATFLVLVRKGASVWPRDMVGNWLYGVAYRIARKARTARARRYKHESLGCAAGYVESSGDVLWQDLRLLLDQELERLPDAYRASVVLCDLEGKTKREAARQLGIPEGTLSSRLARGRRLLRTRLTRRGVTLSLASLTTLLVQQAAAARVGTPMVVSTVRAAMQVAAGQAAAGAVSAGAAVLMEGMVRAMVMRKVLTAMVVLVVVGLIGLGIGLSAYPTAAAEVTEATATEEAGPVPEQKENPVAGEKRLPPPSALTLALVRLDNDVLVVRGSITRADGSDGEITFYCNLARTQVYEAGGKMVKPPALRRLLKQEVLAFVALGAQKVDPLYLRLLKEGTLVFVLPEPEPEAPQPPPAHVPLPPPTRDSRETTIQKEGRQPEKSTEPASKDAPPGHGDVFTIDRRTIEIPFQIDPGDRRIKEVILYVSTDQGRTWQMVARSTADKKSFQFQAPADGLYWFGVRVINQGGLNDSPDTGPTTPTLKVRVQTTPREPAARSDGSLREVTEKQAEKDFNMGEYYRGAGHVDSASFYYELVRRRYPATVLAGKAAERLQELAKDHKPPTRVGQIFIVGNKRTPDRVILDQVPIFPGQVLNYPDLRMAEQKLERLNLFRTKPRVAVIDDQNSGDYKDILIQVEER